MVPPTEASCLRRTEVEDPKTFLYLGKLLSNQNSTYHIKPPWKMEGDPGSCGRRQKHYIVKDDKAGKGTWSRPAAVAFCLALKIRTSFPCRVGVMVMGSFFEVISMAGSGLGIPLDWEFLSIALRGHDWIHPKDILELVLPCSEGCFLKFSLCVCVCVFICVNVSMHMSQHAWGDETTSGDSVYLPLCLRWDFLLFAMLCTMLAGQWASGDSPVSA